MSKVTLALGSFIVGASMMFFVLAGNHASTFAQSSAVSAPGLIPKVPPLGSLNFTESDWVGVTQQLDGLSCKGCKFENVSFTYGGGAFSFKDVSVSKNFRLKLTGAAANTVTLLRIFGALRTANPPIQPSPQAPIPQMATATKTVKVSLESPYGQ